MLDEQYRRTSEILAHALQLDRKDRSAYVIEAAGDDERLRHDVESLLDSGTLFAQELKAPHFHLLGNSPPAMHAGQRVGPYRVEGELGHGATGDVYLASRADGVFTRQVAIKVLKRGMDTSEIVRRFRNERQILASLRHPNIAELYEGGITEDNRHYFVMERVEGEPIDRYCAARQLGIRARIDLFLKVCSAVQFAHQNLVVHRDLKPSNILVGHDGEPKLLDFGIAKLLLPASETQITATRVGLQPMTPAYASPEQVRGERITTASDTYSLGVLLFELLTGRRPYALEASDSDELKRLICTQEPPRPSTAVRRSQGGPLDGRLPLELRRHARRLSGDLDNIVLMALRKQPARRYSSVEMLAHDLRRHLGGLPVYARQDTWAYRLAKLAGRRRKELAVATVLSAIVGALLIDRELEHRQTLRERGKAQQVSEFLVGLFRNPDEDKGDELRARDLLDRAVGKIETEFAQQPAVQADLLSAIGAGYTRLGLFEEAEPLAQEFVRQRRETHGMNHLAVAEALNGLGTVEVSLGHYDDAEVTFREMLRIRKHQLGDSHPRTTHALHALAAVLMDQGEYEAAERLFRRVIRNKWRESGGEPNRGIAAAEGNLGLLLSFQGQYEEASTRIQGALQTSLQLLGDNNRQVNSQRANLADVLRMQGHLDRAESLILVVRSSRRHRRSHPALADTLRRWALVLREQRKLDAAERTLREALLLLGATLAADHPNVIRAGNDLAGVLTEKGQYAEAEALARSALASWRSRLGRHPRVGDALQALAEVLAARGDGAAAEPVAREALALRRACLGDEHPEVGQAMLTLAHIRQRAGDRDEAARLARAALTIFERRLPPAHPRIARAKGLSTHLAGD